MCRLIDVRTKPASIISLRTVFRALGPNSLALVFAKESDQWPQCLPNDINFAGGLTVLDVVPCHETQVVQHDIINRQDQPPDVATSGEAFGDEVVVS